MTVTADPTVGLPHLAPFAEVAETHSAVVVFLGDRAYKVKKPVDLGFLDFRDRAAREAICHREVELNRRLAPDVYLGVADVVDPAGTVCDHLVVMRRLPEDRRLSTLVRSGAEVEGHLWDLAHLLAAFHARADRGPAADRAAGVEATRKRWQDNTAELTGFAGEVFDDVTVGRVHGLAMRYLAGRAPLFEDRIARGRAVDGHGDLLADDIFCLADGPRVLDCIEFADDLRVGDALADVAFLAMDLSDLGRPDLAERFLDAYREHAADAWPASLAHHQVAYRAQVRAKVTAIRARQGDPAAAAHARRLLDLALAHLEAGRVRLVLVGGLPGTGKSSLAAGLAERFPAVVLRSDVVRKELAGLPATTSAAAPVGEGIYTAEAGDRTYATLLARARTGLAHGESVVLDASWADAGRRAEARALADELAADLVELCCVAPAEVTVERLCRRATTGDASDAGPEVAAAMAAAWAPWPEAEVVDTRGPQAETVEVVARRVLPVSGDAGWPAPGRCPA